MPAPRINPQELADFLARCPADLCDRVLELREFVLRCAPRAAETIAFKSLCYYKPDMPYGVIGGHICGIACRGDRVILSFIHGASLPDPARQLVGRGKAMRRIELAASEKLDRVYLRKLLRAAIRHDPAAV